MKGAEGWAVFLRKVGDTSEYRMGSVHSTAVIHGCPLRSRVVVRPEMPHSKSYSWPPGRRLDLSISNLYTFILFPLSPKKRRRTSLKEASLSLKECDVFFESVKLKI